ncbi:putative endoplasmic reticulum translocation complex chain Sec66 [Melampsora larici-populina 98AG31]|uniref:Putative endoplasmic reticulum translocation complex chain Sec66 n=1 Tax=Melampsora larici-populina (strain 98AG31 / pathotype 3-4-7) TaxID=747676 RepID=F4RBS8_MELLP|nr:putative endoplasmic reticulum translocation complex chain Sec66 [Melampsora larici-populina 98AG31]EGG10155.1 putative endoplasmic reticulum translocation complex chain Sec66 [Melampsora larici-populina 98AG31]
MALPLYVPFAYITFLFGLLWLFSRYYRNRALRRPPPPPWFPEPHTARDLYVSLLSMDPPPPQPVLVSALIARAITDVQRIWAIKEAKQAMTNLLQKGQVGDDLWERLAIGEKELELELSEVVSEANEFAEGWGQMIFSVAAEAAQAIKAKEIYKDIEKNRKLKATIPSSDFYNPSELSILNSKAAIPAAQPKPVAAPSPAKQAMLDAIKAAQAKQQLLEQQKQQQAANGKKGKGSVVSTPSKNDNRPPDSVNSSIGGGGRSVSNGGTPRTPETEDVESGSEGGDSRPMSKAGSLSASKKKKPKRKKKA